MNHKNSGLNRIAIVAGRDPSVRDDTDGGSVFLEYLMREFSDLPVEVDVYIPLGIAGGLYDSERMAKQKESADTKLFSNITLRYVPVEKSEQQITEGSDYFYARIEQSKRFAACFSNGVLHSYDAVYILHVANAFFLTQQEYIPREKTVLFPMMTSAHYREFSEVPDEYISYETSAFKALDHICSPSDDEIERIVQNFGVERSKLFKVNRGFDENDFPSCERTLPETIDRPLTLVCANGIRPQKDHLFLVSVLEEFNRKGIDVRIHLTGNNGRSHNPVYNAYTELFWKTLKERGLEDRCVVHDIVSREELALLMRHSDCAVYPSKSETFGKSALESVASGLPTIVCDDVPAFEEFIENEVTGLISPRVPKVFTERIIQLMSNKVLYERISRNGIGTRPKFYWKSVLRELLLAQAGRGIATSIIEKI